MTVQLGTERNDMEWLELMNVDAAVSAFPDLPG
jgi:hypothetical protein